MLNLKDLVVSAMEDLKARNIMVLDVRSLTCMTDYMVIATGTSHQHIQGITNKVLSTLKENGIIPIGIEGKNARDWVLIDLGDVVVHVMMQETREFYHLEKLWSTEISTNTMMA